MTDIETAIIKAIELKKRLRIIYQSDKDFSERSVRPIRLEDGELYAYCYLRRANRRFKLQGILSAVAEDPGVKNGIFGKTRTEDRRDQGGA